MEWFYSLTINQQYLVSVIAGVILSKPAWFLLKVVLVEGIYNSLVDKFDKAVIKNMWSWSGSQAITSTKVKINGIEWRIEEIIQSNSIGIKDLKSSLEKAERFKNAEYSEHVARLDRFIAHYNSNQVSDKRYTDPAIRIIPGEIEKCHTTN